jgi:thiamine biosynthesis lipoprotein
MATVFEIFIIHDDATYARQAAGAAFEELDRLEQELSRYIETSDISRINHLPAHQSLRIGLTTWECLQQCSKLNEETVGAFDITIGPLLNYWRSQKNGNNHSADEEFNNARRHSGFHLLVLEEEHHTIQLKASPMTLDLGGYGKGYAIDRMADLLRDWDIDCALIHGGKSTALALDAPPETDGWSLTINHPVSKERTLMNCHLKNQSISASGIRKGRHIIDPRNAKPITGRIAAWSYAATAATADALSTAFMIMPPNEIKNFCLQHPHTSALIIVEDETSKQGREAIHRFGCWEQCG